MAETPKRVTELDFESIRANLKTYLRSQSEFSDYDFEGSSLSVLIDLLAYNTHYNAMYMNMIANEAFLDSAQLRTSAISHAKLIGYTPRSTRAASAHMNITITPSINEDQDQTTLTLPKYTEFLATAKDGINYPFVNVTAYETTKDGSTFTLANVDLKQGRMQTQAYLSNGLNTLNLYSIPSANVDTNHIYVSVQASASNTDTTDYVKCDNILNQNANSEIFFVQEDSGNTGRFQIQFGDGVIGKTPPNNSIILITYLDTAGDIANKVNDFVLVNDIDGFNDNVAFELVSYATGGAARESLDSIKNNAPRHYNTQNRAVNVKDYEYLILQDYSNIESVKVWSGEDNNPPDYGAVFLSLKPVDGYTITLAEKERIVESIIANRSVVSITPEIIDPNYIYILPKITITYDPNRTTKSEVEIKSLVRANVAAYRNTYLRKFESVWRESQLQKNVELVEKSITGSSIDTFLQSRVTPELGLFKNYELTFNTPLNKGTIDDGLYSYPAVRIYDNTNVLRDAYFEEVPNSFTGIDAIEVITAGTNYESAPTVTILGDGTGATAQAVVVNGKIQSIVVTNRGINYTRATVQITSANAGYGASATAKLQGRNGTLRSFYYNTNSEKIIINSEAGTIDYDSGEIILTNLQVVSVANSNYASGVFTINIRPREEQLYPFKNRILDIDTNDSRAITIMTKVDG